VSLLHGVDGGDGAEAVPGRASGATNEVQFALPSKGDYLGDPAGPGWKVTNMLKFSFLNFSFCCKV